VDLDRAILTVPESRAKNREGDHEVPLSAPALEVLAEAREITRDLRDKTGCVFPNSTETGPISGWSKATPRLMREASVILAGLTNEDRALPPAPGRRR
jgi:hypothetical protein